MDGWLKFQFQNKKGIMEKIYYERHVYESVDDGRLSWCLKNRRKIELMKWRVNGNVYFFKDVRIIFVCKSCNIEVFIC